MKKTAVLLLNLGGPDCLEAVKPFLFNLFSDKEIIPLGPSFLQKIFAYFISVIKTSKTQENYKLIGGSSPLLKITIQQAISLRNFLREIGDIPVFVGMRYWYPFIEDSVKKAAENGIQRLIGLSLYPQYSKATTGSIIKIFEKSAESYGVEYIFYQIFL